MRIPLNRTQSKRLDSVDRFLRRHGAYMAAAVGRLGEVSFSDETETACIRLDGRDVELLFCREFFDSLNTPETAAVLIHEAMHFVFKHIQRTGKIRDPWERRLFLYAAEAVINDIITGYFPHCTLPGSPITGQGLVGRCVADLSADAVMCLLREELEKQPALELKLVGMHETDDHGWLLTGTSGDGWSSETGELLAEIASRFGDNDVYGSSPLGRERIFDRIRPRRKLSDFLREQIKPSLRFSTLWSRPNRKAMSVYPEVVLPVYEQDPSRHNILMAVDTSGSISRRFLSCAVSMAETPLPGNRIELITFDTKAYRYDKGAQTARGGGGTRIQAVEDWIQKQEAYPNLVFVFTDGYSPRPCVEYPDRWTWILEPRGSAHSVPNGSRIERFERDEVE